MITYDKEQQVFHLSNETISYILAVEEYGYLSHLYFGEKLAAYSGNFRYPRLDRSFSPNPPEASDRNFSLDTLLQEYPGQGFGDFREPAYNIKLADGSRTVDFRFAGYRITAGKPDLAGLPATYVKTAVEAETLVLNLQDELSGLLLELSYTIFKEYSVITRSACLRNQGNQVVEINRLASCGLDFARADLELIQLPGTWGRERQLTRERLLAGTKVLDSKRGTSSHQQNPFAALVTPTTSEFQGSAYGFCLVYSGNHETVIQKDPYDQTRLLMGINAYNFAWQLAPAASFQTPEVVLAYSAAGLNDLSATYHRLFNQQLVRGRYQGQERPVLINNWEATYFDFDEEKLLAIVAEACQLGIELFVLDDGWFGRRSSDTTSLGDWFENRDKLPGGLKGLADQVHKQGLKFGLWLEPEMVSADSDLYRRHPDWALAVPHRKKALSRDQYVLDFSRSEVGEAIYRQLQQLFETVPIDYVKWDMNRHLTDVYSQSLPPQQQGETAHRYLLGLYAFMEKMITAYPDILFESCSGGGGRFDAGMLYYMPQTWTSDNTDAVARLKIQYSTSLVYPLSTMGAHVSAVPNHQTQRWTSLKIRGNVAMTGIFGYELDPGQLTTGEKELVKEQIAFYKKHRRLLQYGTFIRLVSPFAGNQAAWMVVAADQSEALVFCFRVLAEAGAPLTVLKLAGLAAAKQYRLGETLIGGDELMQLGFYLDPQLAGDHVSEVYHLIEA